MKPPDENDPFFRATKHDLDALESLEHHPGLELVQLRWRQKQHNANCAVLQSLKEFDQGFYFGLREAELALQELLDEARGAEGEDSMAHSTLPSEGASDEVHKAVGTQAHRD
jgi:hypothetical protein